ncbi:heme-binding protein [Acidisphaera rubrifaciens]|uniref:Uncharacterized protein n=1 Tax=Acidisphaera rubrifaciens HS-AP3 TaxID=1231350 RepID=A0A0D6P318_9PROT|nr:heme-binding protein [Acidisphaera rubrifaciens]GAN76135.1 hypothetical protein Asru_0058_03 [Acidisphaera rubrifaciens HS-AP3]
MSDTHLAPPTIALPGNFRFDQVPSMPPAAGRMIEALTSAPSLGPLAAFTGTFSGTGFNMIFRPQSTSTPTVLPKPAHGPSDNILELNLTSESLAFSPSLGSVPNRGMVQGDIFLNGVPYFQTISDVTNGTPIGVHAEPGLWMSVPTTGDPTEPATVVRMASIPHGTTICLQGTALGPIAGPPTIAPVDPTPFFDATRAPFRFPSQTAADNATFRIPQDLAPFIAAGTITQQILDDPNTILRSHISGQKIVQTTVIEVASAPETPAGPLAVPAIGGGTDSIAFLTGNAGQPNAAVPVQQPGPSNRTLPGVKAIFWIETVEHTILVPIFTPGQEPLHVQAAPHPVTGQPGPIFVLHPPIPIPVPRPITVRSTQIQYSQVVLLNFNGLSWPHVSVATLTPSSPVTVPPSVWEKLPTP